MLSSHYKLQYENKPLGRTEKMTTPIDMTQFGLTGEFNCRGTIASHRVAGRRLLFLFGERHGVIPFIRDNLFNAVELDNLGALSCVGTEGYPTGDFPGPEAMEAFQALQAIHPGDDEQIIDGMLRWFGRRRNFYFWKTLRLLRPDLKIESVDDQELCARASELEWQFLDRRREAIASILRRSELFEPGNPDKEKVVAEKASIQAQQEWAEYSLHLQRDEKFMEKLRSFWNRSGTDKAAILNAGSSHQYRLARLLPEDWSYYHIEQP
jgi:hypothetical protein